MDRYVVVGGGIAGLASAWALARRGAKHVVLIERERALGRHATSQNAAILRTPMPDAHGEDIARRGGEFLRHPPRGFVDGPLLDECGLVLVVGRDTPAEREWTARFAARGTDAVELAPHEVARRIPHVRSGGKCVFLVPREGRIDVPRLVGSFERGARELGVTIELGARVEALLPDGRGVRLAGGRTIGAERTILAAGAWAEPLARAIGSRIALRPTRRHLLVTAPDARVDPRWPVVWTDDDPFYARPEAGGLMLSPCDETSVDPARLAVDPRELDAVRAKAARILEHVELGAIARLWAGIRTHSLDGRFALGVDPDVAGLVWAGALGGHGITCAGPVGELAAQCATDGTCDDPLWSATDPARFARAAVQR